MIRNVVIVLLLGAGLWACSGVYNLSAESKSLVIDDSIQSNAAIDSIISPYQDSLSGTMDEVIAFAPEDFTKGRPNALLNNWAADAIIEYELRNFELDSLADGPIMCLLNVGGLRNPISAGEVTMGDIYKLMPFDNEIVWVQLPREAVDDIAAYIKKSGGEPIAGAKLVGDSLDFGRQFSSETFWVITSDYLMNGGDKMNFFAKKIRFHYGTGLMRDAMINEAKYQGTLVVDAKERIQL